MSVYNQGCSSQPPERSEERRVGKECQRLSTCTERKEHQWSCSGQLSAAPALQYASVFWRRACCWRCGRVADGGLDFLKKVYCPISKRLEIPILGVEPPLVVLQEAHKWSHTVISLAAVATGNPKSCCMIWISHHMTGSRYCACS